MEEQFFFIDFFSFSPLVSQQQSYAIDFPRSRQKSLLLYHVLLLVFVSIPDALLLASTQMPRLWIALDCLLFIRHSMEIWRRRYKHTHTHTRSEKKIHERIPESSMKHNKTIAQNKLAKSMFLVRTLILLTLSLSRCICVLNAGIHPSLCGCMSSSVVVLCVCVHNFQWNQLN